MPWKKRFTEMLYPLDRRKQNIEGAFLLKYTNLPASIYKYRAVNENSKKNLKDSTIWLADPRSMNDPYDSTHSINFSKLDINLYKNPPQSLIDRLPLDKLAGGLLETLKVSDDPKVTLIDLMLSEESIEKREKMKEALLFVTEKMYEDIAHSSADRIKSSFKLCSFSDRVDSTLMWAHYANYHKGFCIEYDVKSLPGDDPRSRLLYPVIYSSEVFDATEHLMLGIESQSFNNLRLNMAGLVKATDWAYENEWRLLFSNGILDKEQAYLMPKPKAVYLGSHISSEDQLEILEICQEIGVPAMKMKHSTAAFKMISCSVEDADRKRLGERT